MRIFLIGFMGAGKSYLGNALAHQLGLRFVDLDEVIEQEQGCTISAIFYGKGEAHFRMIEADCLRGFETSDHLIIATGGGTPCFHSNMEWMNEHGTTIYLHAPVEELASRLRLDREKRPLIASLSEEELLGFVSSKLAERARFYEQSQIKFEAPSSGLGGLNELANYLKRFFSKIF